MTGVWTVPAEFVGERVDTTASRITGLSRSRIGDLITNGKLTVNSKIAQKSLKVVSGDIIEITESEEEQVLVVPKKAPGVRIVFDDADIVVVDKPVGVATHPSRGWKGPSIVEHLAALGFAISTSGDVERQGIVQRLDVGTSGLMMVAKTEQAYVAMKEAFRGRKVRKIYHTLVQGQLEPLTGIIDAPIGRHPNQDYKMAVVSSGRNAFTEYETKEVFRQTSLLQIHLLTGRTHQIRVHMQAVKHPCVGDPIYGADPILAEKLGLVRQWLHSVELSFSHPTHDEWMTFTSDYPADLRHALEIVER